MAYKRMVRALRHADPATHGLEPDQVRRLEWLLLELEGGVVSGCLLRAATAVTLEAGAGAKALHEEVPLLFLLLLILPHPGTPSRRWRGR